jgi:LruC domain-containing protein
LKKANMKFKFKSRPVAVAALALASALGLTGYAINGSNSITWSYLGQSSAVTSPYSASGVASHAGYTASYPASLPVPSMSSNFNARIALMLPEKVDIRNNNQIALSNDDQTNIKLTAPADVWVTFLNEGAGFFNSVGFFTYDPANPPLKPTDVKDDQIILPNASIPPLSAATAQGATVHLGNFAAGRAIGFFVVANGWSATGRTLAGKAVPGVNEKIDRKWIFYSLKGLNPEPSGSNNLNQHTVLLKDEALTGTDGKAYQRLVLGFEDNRRDLGGSDNDFNDIILAVHVSPGSAISNLAGLAQLVTSTTDPDTDKDGVRDSVDEFPIDPAKAFSRWYPGSSSWGTLAYEDSWPSMGDNDFNDLIVRYRSREVLNASRLVSGLEMDLRLDARGGVFHSGFALSLPGIAPGQIKSASLVGPDGVSRPIQALAGQANAVFEIFDDAYTHAPAGTGSTDCAAYYNTGADCPVKASAQFKLVVDLVAAVASFPSAPYDPFIFRTNQTLNTATGAYTPGVAKGTEVHLPGKAPSGRADKTLFGTQDDRSVLGSTTTYRTTANLPWALDIPNEWTYPAEFVDVIRAFPFISTWAGSAGLNNTDWYVTPSNRPLTFQNGR